MSVVSNTGPLHYLLLIDQIDLVPQLYGHVLVPPAVVNDLRAAPAPERVRAWIATPPSWLDERPVTLAPDEALARVDPGERDAILLAKELSADVVLLDDRAGRTAARRLGLVVIGTLGILDEAAERGLVDFQESVSRLQMTNFYVASAIIDPLLRRDRVRRHQRGRKPENREENGC